MPNWCNNSIEIVGPREKIRALWAQAQKDEEQGGGLLRGLRPEPKYEEAAVDGEYAAMPDWWNWRVSNWGTKWEISTEGLGFEEDQDGNYDNGGLGPHARITGWFDSAWAPPVAACEFYADENPDVRITLDYHEPGMCFVGRAVCEDGDLIDDYYEYSGYDSNTVRDAIGDEMDEFWNISEQMAEWEEYNEENQ
jgi:hypothetical protein